MRFVCSRTLGVRLKGAGDSDKQIAAATAQSQRCACSGTAGVHYHGGEVESITWTPISLCDLCVRYSE